MRDDAVLGRALPLDRGLGPALSDQVHSETVSFKSFAQTDPQ